MSRAENKAVFLSYASQDADAARKICDALRAAGVEVWFDQSELRGGDAWDAKIRKQIKECALFVPVISANTQARAEGYFRLEWKLAADRSHLIAHDHPFLVPVVIDETANASARVPAEFHGVQWTRLLQGATTAAFCARVADLLGGEESTPLAAPSRRAVTPRLTAKTAPRARWLVPTAIGVIVVVGLGVWRPWRNSNALNPAHVPAAPAPSQAAAVAPALGPKSIAVLPFGNLSPDKDNEYFTDGIHEDVLGQLLNIRELHVISRTSVMSYRGTAKRVGEIARELGVAFILEGTVRRANSVVRVSAQLIDARTDTPVWSMPPIDRELTTAAIFKIQLEIAQSIAGALRTKLSPQERKLLEQRPTEIWRPTMPTCAVARCRPLAFP